MKSRMCDCILMITSFSSKIALNYIIEIKIRSLIFDHHTKTVIVPEYLHVLRYDTISFSKGIKIRTVG